MDSLCSHQLLPLKKEQYTIFLKNKNRFCSILYLNFHEKVTASSTTKLQETSKVHMKKKEEGNYKSHYMYKNYPKYIRKGTIRASLHEKTVQKTYARMIFMILPIP